jgi:hypothetical protein
LEAVVELNAAISSRVGTAVAVPTTSRASKKRSGGSGQLQLDTYFDTKAIPAHVSDALSVACLIR